MVLLLLLFIMVAPCFAQTAENYRQQAIEASRQKSWDQAIVNYRKALELEPNDPLTHYNLALALKYKGDSVQAVEEFQAAIRLKPRFADAHYGLGATWYDLHEQDSALKELRTATALEPAKAAP
ncbi:MAG TPA: tetratricopeptide repeat protein, partial [Terriglobia bacterium]|nr:tetratricopeptide repeat protein [Terriglobia bacterium]